MIAGAPHSKGGHDVNAPRTEADTAPSRRDEWWAFLALAVLLFPVLSVVVVGGIGFVVWMQQLLFGPTSG
ncbi:MAG: nitrate reductase [Planctomycetes bacterium]|nr:nitrate reductase [Planctomycetota bacterium]